DQRVALTAIALDGQSYAEAAISLGWEPGTVASRVGRARVTLRKLIDDGENTKEP
ncbi:MAG: sigma factor-like helix-turn-helix DNA-binding protein, partial [Alphaproteobacteria bacterium]